MDQYKGLLERAQKEIDEDTLQQTLKGATSPKMSRKKVKMDDCGVFFLFSKQQPHSCVVEFSFKKTKGRGSVDS